MKKLIIVLIAAAAVVGCKNRNKAVVEVTETVTEVMAPVFNAKDSLEYQGTYKGTIPCADCEGIQMSITIDRDGNFKRTKMYLGKGDPTEFADNGKYQWDATGNIIEFLNQKDTDMYLVEKNRLVILDMEGKVVSGELAELYFLTKQPAE